MLVVCRVDRPVARCRACQRPADCRECDGTGLTEAAVELAGALAYEVVGRLPADGFELPAADIATWLRRRAATSPVVLFGRAHRDPEQLRTGANARLLSPTVTMVPEVGEWAGSFIVGSPPAPAERS